MKSQPSGWGGVISSFHQPDLSLIQHDKTTLPPMHTIAKEQDISLAWYQDQQGEPWLLFQIIKDRSTPEAATYKDSPSLFVAIHKYSSAISHWGKYPGALYRPGYIFSPKGNPLVSAIDAGNLYYTYAGATQFWEIDLATQRQSSHPLLFPKGELGEITYLPWEDIPDYNQLSTTEMEHAVKTTATPIYKGFYVRQDRLLFLLLNQGLYHLYAYNRITGNYHKYTLPPTPELGQMLIPSASDTIHLLQYQAEELGIYRGLFVAELPGPDSTGQEAPPH